MRYGMGREREGVEFGLLGMEGRGLLLGDW